jgi:hypothetical protein
MFWYCGSVTMAATCPVFSWLGVIGWVIAGLAFDSMYRLRLSIYSQRGGLSS